MKTILLASVPHTGTRFVEGFLHEAMDGPDGPPNVIELSTLRKQRTWQRTQVGPEAWEAGLDPDRPNLVVTHLGPRLHDAYMPLAAHVPTVVPLRDPLAALVSRYVRKADAWPEPVGPWFDALDRLPTVDVWRPRYIPVDALAKPDRVEWRRGYLGLMADATGCVGDDIEATIEWWANEWPIINHVGADDHPARAAYRDRDVKALWRLLGLEARQRLRALTPRLRPLLERNGYQRLMWWDAA